VQKVVLAVDQMGIAGHGVMMELVGVTQALVVAPMNNVMKMLNAEPQGNAIISGD
jgi:hypothetical protein